MSQPTITEFFNTRKRAAADSLVEPSSKRIILDQNSADAKFKCPTENLKGHPDERRIVVASTIARKLLKVKKTTIQDKSIQDNPVARLFNNATDIKSEIKEVVDHEKISHKTPPASPIKPMNAMDKVNLGENAINFSELKQKLSRSSRLNELKASINRFKKLDVQSKEVRQEIKKSEASLNLKEFKNIELEVRLSPQKPQSPQKQYLSPKRDTSARRNLIHLLSPSKNAVSLFPQSPIKDEQLPSSFTLPYKYRYLMEIFRSLDIACQILHNRKETITFRKLKPAVEEMLKRSIQERHLGQIKKIFPNAFTYTQKKLKVFGACVRHERWELVVKPVMENEVMSSDVLVERRRKFFELLLEEAHKLHGEFLEYLGVKMPREKLRRWHPEFNLDTVPDIESEDLPKPPAEDKLHTGKEVLEKARDLFKTNPRMEKAFELLHGSKEKQEAPEQAPEPKINPLFKGIPQALLEKVRQKQAAKAMENMTRSAVKEKEVQMYRRLPEFARLTRSLFVSEKKNVLPLDTVVDKLGNSFRMYMTKVDIESHLKTLAKETPEWLILHEIRSSSFVKIDKNIDLTIIISRLDAITRAKIAT